MKRYDLISSLVWMLLAIYISFESIQRLGINSIRDPGAGLFPLITSMFLAFSSLLLFFRSIVTKSSSEKIWTRKADWKTIYLVLLALFSYVALIEFMGFLFTTFIFILFLFRVIEPQKWFTSVLSAGTITIISYALFQWWLQSQLPDGILISWLKL